jgi:hypothetical protein
LPRGSVIASARIVRRGPRAHRRRRLELRMARDAVLRITVGLRGRSVRIRTRKVRGCRRYSIALPRGHGRVRISAGIGPATGERRRLRL